jgi:hypothetical protein
MFCSFHNFLQIFRRSLEKSEKTFEPRITRITRKRAKTQRESETIVLILERPTSSPRLNKSRIGSRCLLFRRKRTVAFVEIDG